MIIAAAASAVLLLLLLYVHRIFIYLCVGRFTHFYTSAVCTGFVILLLACV